MAGTWRRKVAGTEHNARATSGRKAVRVGFCSQICLGHREGVGGTLLIDPSICPVGVDHAHRFLHDTLDARRHGGIDDKGGRE